MSERQVAGPVDVGGDHLGVVAVVGVDDYMRKFDALSALDGQHAVSARWGDDARHHRGLVSGLHSNVDILTRDRQGLAGERDVTGQPHSRIIGGCGIAQFLLGGDDSGRRVLGFGGQPGWPDDSG